MHAVVSLIVGFVLLVLAYFIQQNELALTAVGIGLVIYSVLRLLGQRRLSESVSEAGKDQMRQDMRNMMRDLLDLQKKPVNNTSATQRHHA